VSMDVERQSAIALKWSTLAKLLGQGVSWAVTLVVLRLLSPEDYGLMAVATVIVSLVAGVAELGLGSSLIQARSIGQDELRRVAGALLLLNVACAVLIAASAPLFAAWFDEPRIVNVIRVSSLQFILNAIEAVPMALAHRNMAFKRVAGIELSSTFVASLTTLALAWAGWGVWALVLGNLAGGATRAAIFLVQGGWIWPLFRFGGIASHIRFGGAVTATRLLWQFTYQSDVLIAARFLSEQAVGLYSVSVYLATLPMHKAMGIVNQVAFPAVARLQDELPRLRIRLLEAIRLLGFVAVPILWGISAVAPEFVHVLLGEKWADAIVPLQLVSLAAPLRMLSAVLATALAAIGRADLELYNTIVGFVVLPIALLCGAQWQIAGLAAAWLVAVPVIFTLNFPRSSRALDISLRDIGITMRAPLLAGMLMYGVVAGLRPLLAALPEAVVLPLLVIAGGAAYLGAVSLLDRGIWVDVKRLFAAVWSKPSLPGQPGM
jgi:teichuronic acid exporter